MQDFFNLIMLLCASLAAMGVGVMLAYGFFKVGFGLMHWHAQLHTSGSAVKQPQPQVQG